MIDYNLSSNKDAWKDIPFALPNESVEEPVTHEEGLGGELFYSINGASLSVVSGEYVASWKFGAPDHIAVWRRRTDSCPVLDIGLSAEIQTSCGEDIPDEHLWELLWPSYTEHYRNGPFFFHQMKRFSMLLRTRGKFGGCFQVTVTFRPNEVEYRCTYFPPKEWVDASVQCVRTLLHPDGLGSRTDADALFSPGAGDQEGLHWRNINEPALERGLPGAVMTMPFCFPMRCSCGEWFSLSAEPDDGQLFFSNLNTEPSGNGRVALVFDYASPLPLGSRFDLPPVVLRLGAADPFDALAGYARALADKGRLKAPARDPAPWWTDPIACGWREQTLLMQKGGGKIGYDYCTQQTYQTLVDEMDRLNIPFGTLVIDAIWSIGEERWEVDRNKWPDMRGFIETQHRKGRHVLLWVCPNFGSLPENEAYITTQTITVLDDDGNPTEKRVEQRLVDPLNPAYRARIRESLRLMLGNSEGCLNADGLKLDYTGGMPHGDILQCTQPLYGFEYLRAQYKLYHDIAKAVKPDCLLEYQVANPYMADSFDMARLNDFVIFPGFGLAGSVMTDRMRLARAVNFGALVDVDGIRSPEYVRHADEIGVPSIYLGLDDFARCPEYADAARESFLRQRRKYGR